MLSAIYKITGNLWLCVMSHAILNMLSQLTVAENESIGIAAKVIVMIAAIGIVRNVHSIQQNQ